MADTATASVLMTDVRQLTDTENDAHIADAYLLTLIDRSYNKLYRQIATQYESFFDTEDTSKSLIVGQRTYALPATLMHLKAVDLVRGDDRIPLRRFSLPQRSSFTRDPRFLPFGAERQRTYYRYKAEANNLRIDPLPDTTEPLIITYVPRPVRITSGSDTFDVIAGFDDFIIYDAAIQVLMRQERDPSQYVALRQDALQGVIATVSPREVSDTVNVSDVFFGSGSLRW
jgi:hypothetical protein